MRTTIDKAGRLVVPKQLREQLGLRPGVVEVYADGAALRVEPPAAEHLTERDGRLLIPAARPGAGGGTRPVIDDDSVRALRDALQR